ncbi:MAG: glycine--tRNA ligase subunit beta, partial [Candidatus Promineifilaceae bacterium]
AEPAGPQILALEIGSEELPAGDLASAVRQLRAAVPALLDALRLAYESVEVEGTPRRLAALVSGLAPRQPDLESEVKGPPAERAFDRDGKPTQAAIGFARSKGVSPADLKVIAQGERRYAAALVREAGRPATEVLAEALPGLIAGLKFDKSMRWNGSNVAYSRPLRWLVALYGAEIVPFSYAGVVSGRTSRGLRPAGSPPFEVEEAADYRAALAERHITLSAEARRTAIWAAAGRLAEEVGGSSRNDPELLAEVANLVERPALLRGRFDERFLALPPAVLVAVMRKHQRYFPVYAPAGRELLPFFITARNGDAGDLEVVRAGNEHVIEARFADAEFFYRRDVQRPLAAYLPELATLTFQAKLGSMLEKVERLRGLTPAVAELLGLDGEETEAAARAAGLSKADLATGLVVEMTALQGLMGGHYARLSGEPEPVAAAIGEQYEAVSATRPGLALALADRLDSLMGLTAAGLAPKGSNDPFGLRRAAVQVVENLVANKVSFDLRQGLAAAAEQLPIPAAAGDVAAALAFVQARLASSLQERGARASVVRAILAEQGHDPYAAVQAAAALEDWSGREEWPALLEAYARCARISRDQPDYALDPSRLALAEELALWEAYQAAAPLADGSVAGLAAALGQLRPAISAFFDEVLVMDPDLDARHNRLALLQRIAALGRGTADLSHLEGF